MVASKGLAVAMVIAALGLTVPAGATETTANPIRKVVTMLQDMTKEVEEEGEKEEDLFDKFMCYCSNGEGALDASIAAGKASIEQLGSTVQRGTAEKSQLEQDIVQHKADREEAEKVIKESTAMREKEAAEFAASSGDMKSNIQSCSSALAALKKGLSASLLQTGVGQFIRNVIRTSPAVRDSERDMLVSFLESGSGMEGGSDQIIGILEQMLETMQSDLAESEGKEAESKKAFEELMTSKTSEIAAAGKAVETKTARVGQVAVEIVQAGADQKATEKAVAEDIEFKANLGKMCAIKQKEMDERRKLRAQELEALSDTIKMLNSDDALELFKKSVPSAAASFLQTSSTSRSQMRSKMRRVKSLIQDAMSADKAHSRNRQLMLLALSSGMGGFEKVVGMVDGMVGVLEEEQVGDDKTEAWCKAELDKAEGELKTTEVDLEALRATIDETRDAIANTASEIEALKAGLVELDKSVAEATEQRKKEHEEMLETVAGNQAAVELLGMAKNRLNKFYNPSLYKEPEKKADDEDFVQMAASRAAPGPPPEMPSGEYKKSESSSGVIAMITEMTHDVESDIAEAKRDEEEAQKDYEEDMNDAATKRSDDSKLIVTKEGEKAEQAGKLEESKEAKRTKSGQLDVLESQIANTHKVCDFLLAEYAKIKEERTKEEEGLKASKQVLSGAKAFLQH
jgi:hypothetical protein